MWAIPDNIAETVNSIDVSRFEVAENTFERSKVPVHVADYGKFLWR